MIGFARNGPSFDIPQKLRKLRFEASLVRASRLVKGKLFISIELAVVISYAVPAVKRRFGRWT
jgi:hypothetical protein